MSSCDVTVRLDGPVESLVAGSDVTGVVTVTACRPTEPADLQIQQLWRAHGRGNTDETAVEERIEKLPPLSPGLPHEVRFRFRAPDHPVSYHGHLVNLDHFVRARVEGPWTRDPRVEADYVVVPGPRSAEAYTRATARGAAGRGVRTPGCLKAALLVLAPLLAILRFVSLVFVLPVLIITCIAVLVWRSLPERRLGKVSAELGAPAVEEPPTTGPVAALGRKLGRAAGAAYIVCPGDTVKVTLRFTPRVGVSLGGARLEVLAAESSTSGSGTDATTQRHVVWSRTVTLLEPVSLSRGQPVDVTSRIELPRTGAFTLSAASNRVTWTASFHLDLPGWRDWVREHELLVIPPR